MQDRFFTDEELTAYLDGEAEFTDMDAITQALQSDVELQDRLAGLALDTDVLQQSLQDVAPSLQPTLVSAEPIRFGMAQLGMAACVALAIGFGAGQWLNRPTEPGWIDYVASYQSLYSTQTLENFTAAPAAQRVELERVGTAFGKQFSLEALIQTSGVEYKRAQVLSYKGKPLLQLAFVSPSGAPIALCVIRGNSAETKPIDESTREGLSAASWSTGGFNYLLIGGQDPALVSNLASQLETVGL